MPHSTSSNAFKTKPTRLNHQDMKGNQTRTDRRHNQKSSPLYHRATREISRGRLVQNLRSTECIPLRRPGPRRIKSCNATIIISRCIETRIKHLLNECLQVSDTKTLTLRDIERLPSISYRWSCLRSPIIDAILHIQVDDQPATNPNCVRGVFQRVRIRGGWVISEGGGIRIPAGADPVRDGVPGRLVE